MRVAFTVAERAGSGSTGRLLRVVSEQAVEDDAAEVAFGSEEGRIQSDLSIGAELDSTQLLLANSELSNRGYKLGGAGFIVSEADAKLFGLGELPELSKYIRPYRNSRDLTDKPRGVWVIDLFGLNEIEVLTKFPLSISD